VKKDDDDGGETRREEDDDGAEEAELINRSGQGFIIITSLDSRGTVSTSPKRDHLSLTRYSSSCSSSPSSKFHHAAKNQ
jgi:hypothetical protein